MFSALPSYLIGIGDNMPMNNFANPVGVTLTECSLPCNPGQWFAPCTTGRTPPPSDGISVTRVDRRRAVWFGGYDAKRQRRTNAVFILDIVTWVSG